jgi:hypothetical protein
MIDAALEKYRSDEYAVQNEAVQKAKHDLEIAEQNSDARKIEDKKKTLIKAEKKLERCSNWKNWLEYTRV